MKKILYSFLISTFLLASCGDQKSKSIETPEPQFTKEATLTFKKMNGEKVATFAIEIAKSSYEKQTGLMYRKSMKNNQGMLFVYEDERPRPGFYMKNTYIALDLIYINAANEIVDFNQNAEPFNETPLPSAAPAKYVLEVNAGTVSRLGLTLGDKIVLERID